MVKTAHDDDDLMEIVTREELLRRLRHERDAFETLMARLAPDQLANLPVVGFWTMRDVLAHFIAHEQLALDELRHALRGDQLEVDHANLDAFNAAAVDIWRNHSLDDVHAAWDVSFAEVVAAVIDLADDDFEPDSSTVVALDDSIDGALGNNTYGHYAEHGRDIKRVLAEVG